MATPHVSGVISLMLAANHSLSPSQIEQILKQTARPFPTVAAWGRVHVLE